MTAERERKGYGGEMRKIHLKGGKKRRRGDSVEKTHLHALHSRLYYDDTCCHHGGNRVKGI